VWYLTFGNQTVGDILKNFNPDDKLAIVARLALACVVIFTYPLANHSVREGVINFYYGGKYSTDSLPTGPFVIITVCIIAPTTLLGIVCTQVEDVLAYKGGIFGSLMVYIFPALMYTRLQSISDSQHQVSTQEESMEPGYNPVCGEEGITDPGNLILSTVKAFYTSTQWLTNSFLFTWGALTGILAVTITILQQSGVL